MRHYFLFFYLVFFKLEVQIVLTILEYCWVGSKTSTVTAISIPGIEASGISVIHKELVQLKFQVVSG